METQTSADIFLCDFQDFNLERISILSKKSLISFSVNRTFKNCVLSSFLTHHNISEILFISSSFIIFVLV
jgi:hypothetical protein